MLVLGVTCGGTSSWRRKCPAPGRRKSIGETLLVALIPLQPAVSSNKPPHAIGHAIFQFKLTVG
jgi:hypothetical protein